MSASPRAGFTLIEILAVMLILSILVTLLVTQLGGAEDVARVELTRQRLAVVGAAADHYENEFGDYPPSTFGEESGVLNDGTNVGIEAFVVALWSAGWDAGGVLSDLADQLVNSDDDVSPRSLTDFETRALLEIPDAWGNPIAYFHRRDYALANREYATVDPASGVPLASAPRAFENPVTGRYYQATRYQLISAGPDGAFGTEDDITAFDRGGS